MLYTICDDAGNFWTGSEFNAFEVNMQHFYSLKDAMKAFPKAQKATEDELLIWDQKQNCYDAEGNRV